MNKEAANAGTHEFHRIMAELDRIANKMDIILDVEETSQPEVFYPHKIHYIADDLHKLSNDLNNGIYDDVSIQMLKGHAKQLRKFAEEYRAVEEDMETSQRIISEVKIFTYENSNSKNMDELECIISKYESKLF